MDLVVAVFGVVLHGVDGQSRFEVFSKVMHEVRLRRDSCASGDGKLQQLTRGEGVPDSALSNANPGTSLIAGNVDSGLRTLNSEVRGVGIVGH